MKKRLFLFTSEFPYGTGERYLESEIDYLCKGFDKVTIYATHSKGEITRKIPVNCEVNQLGVEINFWRKIWALWYIFHPIFIRELSIIINIYKQSLNLKIIFTMLISLYQSGKIVKKVSGIINHAPKDHLLYFYSYWCDDIALGLARIQKKNASITTVSRIHRWDVYFEESKINYLPFRHFISEHLKGLFPISEDAKEYCQNKWKVRSSKKNIVSPLGVSRKSLPKKKISDSIVIVSCSNLIPVKRVNLIIQSLSLLKNMPITWYHFGNGSEHKHLQQLATTTLSAHIDWHLMGEITNKDLMRWYASNHVDVFINLSSSEGIPVSIMEAMSFGIPVVATNVGGTREIVNDFNGKLLNENPLPEEVAESLKNIFHLSPDLKQKLKKNALETWNKKFNAEVNYPEFIHQVYLLGNSGSIGES